MKCKMCSGAGVIQGQAPCLVSCCPACDGKGFIEQTNEEWLRQCTTEQLAEFLENVEIYGNAEYVSQETKLKTDLIVKHIWAEWLKQPHTNFVGSRKW